LQGRDRDVFSRPSKLNTDAHTNSPIQRHRNHFCAPNAFMAKSGAQTLTFNSVTNRQTDRQTKKLKTNRQTDKKVNIFVCPGGGRLKSEPHQTWHVAWPHCVRLGPSSPQKKGHGPTQFLAHFYCAQTAGWIKMLLGTEVNLSPGHIVLDGVAAPPNGGTAPQFLAHVYCVQVAAWMNTSLGTEVDLGPCYIVLDRDPAPRPRGRGTVAPPLFSVHVYCGHGRPSLLSSCYIGLF